MQYSLSCEFDAFLHQLISEMNLTLTEESNSHITPNNKALSAFHFKLELTRPHTFFFYESRQDDGNKAGIWHPTLCFLLWQLLTTTGQRENKRYIRLWKNGIYVRVCKQRRMCMCVTESQYIALQLLQRTLWCGKSHQDLRLSLFSCGKLWMDGSLHFKWSDCRGFACLNYHGEKSRCD